MFRFASARDLLNAVTARYRGLASYADVGHVRRSLRSGDHVMPFETARGERGDFRFAFDLPHPYPPLRHKVTRHVVGRDGALAYGSMTRHGRATTTERASSFDLAIAGATGISGGAAHTIAQLLFEEVSGWSFADLKRPRLRGPRFVDGVWCHRVTGLQGRSPLAIDIGVDDLMVRRIVDRKGEWEEVRKDINLQASFAPEFFRPPAEGASTL